jgi:hypothetical protein
MSINSIGQRTVEYEFRACVVDPAGQQDQKHIFVLYGVGYVFVPTRTVGLYGFVENCDIVFQIDGVFEKYGRIFVRLFHVSRCDRNVAEEIPAGIFYQYHVMTADS